MIAEEALENAVSATNYLMKNKKLLIVAGSISLFTCLVVGVSLLVRSGVIGPEIGLLMLISLFGMYVGFGVLIAVYRLIIKLD